MCFEPPSYAVHWPTVSLTGLGAGGAIRVALIINVDEASSLVAVVAVVANSGLVGVGALPTGDVDSVGLVLAGGTGVNEDLGEFLRSHSTESEGPERGVGACGDVDAGLLGDGVGLAGTSAALVNEVLHVENAGSGDELDDEDQHNKGGSEETLHVFFCFSVDKFPFQRKSILRTKTRC
jgi:hypothetical protein